MYVPNACLFSSFLVGSTFTGREIICSKFTTCYALSVSVHVHSNTNIRVVRLPGGTESDSDSKGPEFDPYMGHRVVSLIKGH